MDASLSSGITPQQHSRVAELLGRKPRGLRQISVVRDNGDPMVIRVASLVEDKPFPTLFWLIDPEICYRIDVEEASGLIARLQQRINEDPALRESMEQDHHQYIRLRHDYMDEQEQQRLVALGFESAFSGRGIGGIADFSRIRCLHTWYGAHLVVANTVGRLLDEHWQDQQ